MGDYVDSLKFAGGSFSLMPRPVLIKFLKLCHDHDILVSTGGFLEYVLTNGADSISRYIEECKRVGFDIIEISCGFITIPADDWLRRIEKVKSARLKPKPEIGIQIGAGGATRAEDVETAETRDPEWPIRLAQCFLDASAYLIIIESEGITENVKTWRTDVPAGVIGTLGLEKMMFEDARSGGLRLYIKNYGPEVNLLSITVKLSNWNACAPAFGEPLILRGAF